MRKRKREGAFGVVLVEIYETEVAELVRRGLLAEADAGNRLHVGKAIERLLDRVLA